MDGFVKTPVVATGITDPSQLVLQGNVLPVEEHLVNVKDSLDVIRSPLGIELQQRHILISSRRNGKDEAALVLITMRVITVRIADSHIVEDTLHRELRVLHGADHGIEVGGGAIAGNQPLGHDGLTERSAVQQFHIVRSLALVDPDLAGHKFIDSVADLGLPLVRLILARIGDVPVGSQDAMPVNEESGR